MEQPIRYAVLRDQHTWEAQRTGLDVDASGALVLARVPGPTNGQPVQLPGPFAVPPSGLALGPCGEVFVLYTPRAQLIAHDEVCGTRRVLPACGTPGDGPGELREPRALLYTPDALYIGDAGNGRVLRYLLPGLELAAVWGPPLLVAPVGLATDQDGYVYVLDATLNQVFRFSAWGVPDNGWNLMPAPQTPAALAIAHETLYVSDAASNTVHAFALDGTPQPALPSGGPTQPRALATTPQTAVSGPPSATASLPSAVSSPSSLSGRLRSAVCGLYIADAATGQIWVFDIATHQWKGIVPGYTGPVAALAVGANGDLWIKPGQGPEIIHLSVDAACVAGGVLRAGPFDAGLEAGWGRVMARAEGADVTMRCYTADAPDAPPTTNDFQVAPTLDALAPRAEAGDVLRQGSRPRRYLWIEIELRSTDNLTSPRLLDVHAESANLGYLAHVPAIYRRPETPEQLDFLHDWLHLIRSVIGDLSATLDAMPRRFDLQTAPNDQLAWLATWLAFEPPSDATPARLRELLALLPTLYPRRGTPAGLRALIQLFTGAEARIVEDFRTRHVWQLGITSSLGFDTALAPAAPAGAVVPDERAPLVVGDVRVGQSGPLEKEAFGGPLFADSAFRFSVIVPAAQLPEPEARAALRQLVERERPAYAEAHICYITPTMRVGFQARVGIDSIVAGPPAPLALTGTVLGHSSVLGDSNPNPGIGRVGNTTRLGRDTVIA